MTAWHVFRLLRPKQWVKNFFVLAPLLFAGEVADQAASISALWAFGYFCLAASCVYVLNDLSDVDADKKHPLKSLTRPLASGDVRVRTAIWVLAFGVALLVTGFWVIPVVMLPIVGYIAINVLYSLFARSVPVLDIFTIAFGFVLRVVGGALAIGQPLSAWMFVTTLCLALYLAAMKRRHELKTLGSASRSSLESYSAAVVERFAEISATAALVCYSIFVITVKAELVYTIPLVAFGLFRYWFIAENLKSAESPTEAMLRDWPLLASVVLWVGVCAGVLLFAGN
jgi:decaprenyl-phosphate phosphoribosyltransferase